MKEGAKARGRILDVDKKAGVIDVSLRPEFVMSGEVPIPSPPPPPLPLPHPRYGKYSTSILFRQEMIARN